MKKIGYVFVGLAGNFFYNISCLAGAFSPDKGRIIGDNIESRPLDQAIQYYVNFLISFLYLVAVLYALWGGFLILTAGGEDEKVTKGKTILIQGGLGLLVIWLSGTIVKWILSVLVA